MQGAANGLLLLDAFLFFVAGYRLGWAVIADAAYLPPNLAAVLPRLRRMYRISLLLAFLSCLLIAGHLALAGVADTGVVWTRATVGVGGALALVALWFSAVAHRHAR